VNGTKQHEVVLPVEQQPDDLGDLDALLVALELGIAEAREQLPDGRAAPLLGREVGVRSNSRLVISRSHERGLWLRICSSCTPASSDNVSSRAFTRRITSSSLAGRLMCATTVPLASVRRAPGRAAFATEQSQTGTPSRRRERLTELGEVQGEDDRPLDRREIDELELVDPAQQPRPGIDQRAQRVLGRELGGTGAHRLAGRRANG